MFLMGGFWSLPHFTVTCSLLQFGQKSATFGSLSNVHTQMNVEGFFPPCGSLSGCRVVTGASGLNSSGCGTLRTTYVLFALARQQRSYNHSDNCCFILTNEFSSCTGVQASAGVHRALVLCQTGVQSCSLAAQRLSD